jgi:hypothetical protein
MYLPMEFNANFIFYMFVLKQLFRPFYWLVFANQGILEVVLKVECGILKWEI